MQTTKGVFIVIEGTDGSGKGTQFSLLTERLRKEGYDVAAFDFPRYEEPSSYFVREYLNGAYGGANDVPPYTASLFYALDRYQAAPAIRAALEQGKIVISNRFTGSNMAHQGTKFLNAEERRGYFIWLDNLEYEMLRIPRPDVSLVLRVPADIAQGLVDQKAPRDYIKQGSRDIHEDDITHLRRAVAVFDDMCHLFPKDFTRVDCVRSGTLLSIETVQALLWEKVAPLLPPPGTPAPQPAPEPAKTVPAEPPAVIATRSASGWEIAADAVSRLLALKLRQLCPGGLAELAAESGDSNLYYVPEHLSPELHAAYTQWMDLAVKQPAVLAAQAGSGAGHAERAAFDALQPLATLRRVALHASEQELRDLVNALAADALPEARAFGLDIRRAVRQTAPDLLQDTEQEAAGLRGTAETAAALTAVQLPSTHNGDQQAVRLISASPRNELDVVAQLLYSYSDQPLAAIRAAVDRWPYEQKAAALHDAITEAAIGGVQYAFELCSDIATLEDTLRRLGVGSAQWQPPTPRFGFDVPGPVEAAGLSDAYEACFDQSLQLYSQLQQAGLAAEAPYAVLAGHRARWQLTFGGRAALRLERLLNAADTFPSRPLLVALHEQLASAHPIIARAFYSGNT